MKVKVLEVWWDKEWGEAKIKFTDEYKKLTGVSKLDLKQDIDHEFNLVAREGLHEIKEFVEEKQVGNKKRAKSRTKR
jgi:hypothetical protein